MRNSFFDNNVTTLTTGETWYFKQDDYIQITYRSGSTSTPTATTDSAIVYRVKTYTTYTIDVTPISRAEQDSWFPTRRELNNQAAQRGARAQAEKHDRIPKKALVLRSSYQGMARLPCYRGTRPR